MNLLYLPWGVNPTSKNETVQLANFGHASKQSLSFGASFTRGGSAWSVYCKDKHSRSEYQGLVLIINLLCMYYFIHLICWKCENTQLLFLWFICKPLFQYFLLSILICSWMTILLETNWNFTSFHSHLNISILFRIILSTPCKAQLNLQNLEANLQILLILLNLGFHF